MPSVGLRRTTRVFGVVKGVDGARVLRSGRKLWPESGEGKLRRSNDGDEWFQSIMKTTANNHNKTHINNKVNYKENGWALDSKWKTDHGIVIAIEAPRSLKKGKNSRTYKREKRVKAPSPKRFGIVYSRKRKRVVVEKSDNLEVKKYGIQFSRRQRRKKEGGCSLVGVECTPELVVAVEGFSSGSNVFSNFFILFLRYIMRKSLRLSELAGFLFSEPVNGVFASNGLHFMRGLQTNRTGICKFFGTRQLLPMFSVDFSAIPSCFLHMHLSLFVRFKCLSLTPVNNSIHEDDDDDDEMINSSAVDHSFVPMETDMAGEITVVPEADNSGSKVVLHPSVRASRLTGRNSQYRNGLNSRGIQKRRTSLRRGRPRNASLVGLPKANGALVSDLISSRKNGIPFSSVVSKNKLMRRSVRNSLAANLKVNSAVAGVNKSMNLCSCSANVLVTETDRCYRIEGATVTLEINNSGEWVLVVKKDGLPKYTHLAQKIMRPCGSNRFTHDIIWTGDESWKLEFPNRQDWFIFKDLYKECADRNVPSSVAKAIPVPRVQEVLDYEVGGSSFFSRPHGYISLNNDEVARALARKTASYDMDSEDEEWLKNFNNEFLGESDYLSEDNFELMIDALEKAYYCSPDDFSNENAAPKLCMDFGRKEVAEAVYGHWMKKRKQRRSALLRVFQGHQAKKTTLTPKPALRKRRSFKRAPSQCGRGKQPNLLQAMAAEQDALEEQNALRKVEEAQNSAKRSVELAILKRQRAQLLMKNADLATYKAVMALRIAEATRVGSSTDVAVADFF